MMNVNIVFVLSMLVVGSVHFIAQELMLMWKGKMVSWLLTVDDSISEVGLKDDNKESFTRFIGMNMILLIESAVLGILFGGSLAGIGIILYFVAAGITMMKVMLIVTAFSVKYAVYRIATRE